MSPVSVRGIRPGGRHLGASPRPARPDLPTAPEPERRGAQAPVESGPREQGPPGPGSTRPEASPDRTPVPTPAHPIPRAIRVHWSPR
ncbi:hypothetical protein ABT133_13380 [Streptomyces sp. NPDC001835]|uniref:hypothetical protein n=1 Tax=unclassified Streptomyces TaxID=2593676 RepID=UPI003333E9FB